MINYIILSSYVVVKNQEAVRLCVLHSQNAQVAASMLSPRRYQDAFASLAPAR